MKKILLASLLVFSTTVFAHGPHGYWRPAPNGGWHWVSPAIIGGVIGYGLTRNYYEPYYAPAPVVVQQPPVVVQQPPVVVQQPNTVYSNPTVVYDCVDTLKPSSVPGNEHIVRTCTQRIQ